MSNKTILFADDSATMRTIMENTFAAEPYDVSTVPSGEAAIMKARELHPDIIIADGGMAGVSGYDICRAVREDPSLGGTPFIILAGVSSPYDDSRGTEVGIDEYIKKPFDTTQLIEKVGELSDREPKAVPAAAEPEVSQTPQISPDVPTAPPPSPILDQQPLTEKPAVAPAGPQPIASPVAARAPLTKDTMEYGTPSRPPEPAVPEPIPDPIPEPIPEPEPIELGQPPEESTFQVGTLAEMAQMDEKGAPIEHTTPDDAIELISTDEPPIQPSPPTGGQKPAPRPSVSSLPIAKAVKERARVAAEEVEAQVDGLSDKQLEVVQSLTAEVVERVVWEIVPDLAEAIIKEELARLLEE